MKKLIAFLQTHIKVARGLVILCGAFFACFTFPIRVGDFPLGWLNLYVQIAAYAAIAEGFSGVYGPGKIRWVWLMALLSTVLGLVGRYLLEFGEVSNIYNFTPFNLVAFLLVVPLGTAAAYHHFSRKKEAAK